MRLSHYLLWLMDESRRYVALLNIKAVGKNTKIPNGVVFGDFTSQIFVDEEGKDYPAMVILPEAIWKAEGKMPKLAVSIKFLKEGTEDLEEFEDTFMLMVDNGQG